MRKFIIGNKENGRYIYSSIEFDDKMVSESDYADLLAAGYIEVGADLLEKFDKKLVRWNDTYTMLESTPEEVIVELNTIELQKQQEQTINDLRFRRGIECFSVINRGQLWYNKLTDDQKNELSEWYQQWLDAPETGVIPKKPSWLN